MFEKTPAESSQTDLQSDPVTAVDYIESQLELEKEAKELMPYDPNTCTFLLGPLRQQVFACLTCSESNGQPSGVCYSCSIQCHSTHEIVELFTKRDFTCDCGTTRMVQSGACKIRSRTTRRDSTTLRSINNEDLSIGKDVPSSSNEYNQNYKGIFCSCSKEYDPLEETGNMIQCALGFNCGEDWFHDECIMGYIPGSLNRKKPAKFKSNNPEGVNLLDQLPPPGLDAHTENLSKSEFNQEDTQVDNENIDQSDNELDVIPVEGFPDLDDFDTFICWKCVGRFHESFEKFNSDIVFTKIPHIECGSLEERERELSSNTLKDEDGGGKTIKKRKIENDIPYSIFFKDDYKENIFKLKEETTDETLIKFLEKFPFLYEDDPIYEPAEEDEDDDMSSIFDLGAKALNTLPREQAIEGLHAYEQIKEKLRGFLRPFADQGKVVTENEIRDFFAKATEERSKI